VWGRLRPEYHRRVPDTLVVLIVILILVLIWRGPKTLPQIGAMLGRGVRDARREAARLQADEPPKDPPPTS
jgi:Sec-independent protein translocase protein TatA